MNTTSTPPYATGRACRSGPFPRRSLEIGAIVLGFVYWWPVGLALLAWKLTGYPAVNEMRDAARRNFGSWDAARPASRFARAFEAANGAPATRRSMSTAARNSTGWKPSVAPSRKRAALSRTSSRN